jgi:hypothetical protein
MLILQLPRKLPKRVVFFGPITMTNRSKRSQTNRCNREAVELPSDASRENVVEKKQQSTDEAAREKARGGRALHLALVGVGQHHGVARQLTSRHYS